MTYVYKSAFMALVVGLFLYLPNHALAATPQLSVTMESGSARIIVSNANPFSSVNLYVQNLGSTLWGTVTNFGQTDGNGYLSQLYGAAATGTSFYVTAAGLQSNTAVLGSSGCSYYGCGSGGLVLSPTSVSVGLGQSTTVTASTSYYNLYLSSNSNPNIATASINGSVITIYGNNSGTTSMMFCTNLSSQCGSVYVTVGSGYGGGQISFSQSSVNLNQYQSSSVSIFGGSGSYYVSSNSNPSAVSSSVSGSSLNLYGSSMGSSSITVCSSYSQCGSVFVTVGSGYSGQISLSQSNVSLGYNQTATITVYSPYSSSFYISSNSNPQVASAYISGSSLSVSALGSGSTTVTVCTSGTSSCASLYVTVSGYGGYGSGLYFTTTTLPQPVSGQYYSQQLQVSGGSAPYSFVLSSGALPAGLTLGSTGFITGYPQYSTTSTFTVQVRDFYSRTAQATFTMSSYSGVYQPSYPYYGGTVYGSTAYANGTLVSDRGTVYLIYRNGKSGFDSLSAFQRLGYKLSSVIAGDTSSIPNSGFVITNSQSAHPWGSWVKSGQTVYFVYEQGLIPIGSWDVFISNGGQDSLVVPANSFDLSMPYLPIMTFGDSRLR